MLAVQCCNIRMIRTCHDKSLRNMRPKPRGPHTGRDAQTRGEGVQEGIKVSTTSFTSTLAQDAERTGQGPFGGGGENTSFPTPAASERERERDYLSLALSLAMFTIKDMGDQVHRPYCSFGSLTLTKWPCTRKLGSGTRSSEGRDQPGRRGLSLRCLCHLCYSLGGSLSLSLSLPPSLYLYLYICM